MVFILCLFRDKFIFQFDFFPVHQKSPRGGDSELSRQMSLLRAATTTRQA